VNKKHLHRIFPIPQLLVLYSHITKHISTFALFKALEILLLVY